MSSDRGQFFHTATLTAAGGAAIVPVPPAGSQTGSILFSVTINTKGATSNILTLYNGGSTSAPVIAAIDTTQFPGTFTYNVPVNAGLWYTLLAGTAADITVTFS